MPVSVTVPPVFVGGGLGGAGAAAGGAAAPPSAPMRDPHLLQKRASSEFGAPQLGQKLMARGVYTTKPPELGGASLLAQTALVSATCGFCGAPLALAPAGAAVRCGACGNVTTTPALPPTLAATPVFEPAAPSAPSLPFSSVSGPKPGASPPPAVVLPSRAGGVDELVGGGITILGIGLLKIVLVGLALTALSCTVGIVGMLLR